MLPRKNRITNDKEFQALYRKGRRVHTPHFVLTYAAGADSLRIASVISKKVSKKATDRNALNRKIHEAVAEEILKGPRKSSAELDVVVSAKAGSTEISYAAIRDEIAKGFRKIGGR